MSESRHCPSCNGDEISKINGEWLDFRLSPYEERKQWEDMKSVWIKAQAECSICAAKDAEIARLTVQLAEVTRGRDALLAKQSAWWQNNKTLIEEMQRLLALIRDRKRG